MSDEGWTTVTTKKRTKTKSANSNPYQYGGDAGGAGGAGSGAGAGAGAGHQDWKEVVLRKKHAPTKSKVNLTAAKRSGNTYSVAKYGGGGNKNVKQDYAKLNKIDRETEELSHKRVNKRFQKQLAEARHRAGLSQKELARKMNLAVSIVASYENGQAIADGYMMNRFRKVLGF